MNEQEFNLFLTNARTALKTFSYSNEEIDKILNWIEVMKASDERELLGDKCMDHLSAFNLNWPSWGIKDALAHNLMARVFLYAPLILDPTIK